MKTEIFESYEEFLSREDKNINGVSPRSAEANPNYSEMNKTNIGCWNCKDCEYCCYCVGCWNCKDCEYCCYCVDCVDSLCCSYSDCLHKKINYYNNKPKN